MFQFHNGRSHKPNPLLHVANNSIFIGDGPVRQCGAQDVISYTEKLMNFRCKGPGLPKLWDLVKTSSAKVSSLLLDGTSDKF